MASRPLGRPHAPGQDPDRFAIARAQREKGGFSDRNTRILMLGDLHRRHAQSWPIPAEPLPTDDLPTTDPPTLENLAPRGALDINGLAIFPTFRRQGHARWTLGQVGRGHRP